MPFFQNLIQTQNYCAHQNYARLKELNHKYCAHLITLEKQIEINDSRKNILDERIKAMSLKTELYTRAVEQANTVRHKLLINLPDNPSERFLALRATSYLPDDHCEVELKKLQQEKTKCLNLEFALTLEKSNCIKELKIINQFLDQLALTSNLSHK